MHALSFEGCHVMITLTVAGAVCCEVVEVLQACACNVATAAATELESARLW